MLKIFTRRRHTHREMAEQTRRLDRLAENRATFRDIIKIIRY